MHMTPQEAAYHEFMEPIRKLELVNEMEDQAFYNLFQAGAKWQSEQDNQALSSALKEIAELHAKVNEMKDALNGIVKEIDQTSMITWVNKAYIKAKSVLK